MLLYDLTSTYFEGPMEENPKAKYGHSSDRRTDCLQLVIALVITTDGFPLAYEVTDGNTSGRTTLGDFLDHIEKNYGKAKRMWVMDRGIPTEEMLQEMRNPAREIFYLVGTPKGKIQQYERRNGSIYPGSNCPAAAQRGKVLTWLPQRCQITPVGTVRITSALRRTGGEFIV